MTDCCSTNQPMQAPAEALERMLGAVAPSGTSETVPLNDALGRVLARDLVSRVTAPPHDNSAMDGYALRAADARALGGKLPLSGVAAAGQPPVELPPGTAMRIFTGAPIPHGADTVVMQERCAEGAGQVTVPEGPTAGDHIRMAGEDLTGGAPILAGGTRLQPQHLALAATAGYGALPVRPRLRVAVLVTGDELVDPGTDIAPGQIFNSNGYALLGLLQGLGCDVRGPAIVPDDPDTTRTMLEEAADDADFIVTSGGVSVGDADFVKDAVDSLGHLDLWRISIKPGKPIAFGQVNSTPFLGLPGNPVSMFVTFCLFGRPLILKRQGVADVHPRTAPVRADFTLDKADPRTRYLRARIATEGDHQRASLYPDQGSGIMSSTTWANALLEIPPDTPVRQGAIVQAYPYYELLN